MHVARKALRVLVVDDEPLGRARLTDLLGRMPDVELAGTGNDGAEAVRAIRTLHPDLVFLDVQMPRMSGLEVIQKIGPDEMPPTIFVTAHQEYAIRAFELAAVDYLVKPFSDERFEETLRRARHRIELEGLELARGKILSLLGHSTEILLGFSTENGPAPTARRRSYLERIAVQSKGKVRVVPVSQIEYIQASDYYAELHTGNKCHLIREALSSLEDRLDPEHFVRVHRSFIVRLECIDTILRGERGDYHIQLKSGARLPMSRHRRDDVKLRLGQ